MPKKFIQLSSKPGYMKHNGGLLFREISKNEYEFKTKIKKNHLNMAGITHGGYIASIIDAGAGTGAHRSTDGKPCVTISLDIKFIGSTELGDEIIGFTFIISVAAVILLVRWSWNQGLISKPTENDFD